MKTLKILSEDHRRIKQAALDRGASMMAIVALMIDAYERERQTREAKP